MPKGIYKRTEKNRGWKLSPETREKISKAKKKFGVGKWMIGRKLSKETRARMSEERMDEKNPMWKGENVGYGQLHVWVKKRKPKTKLCECCNKVPPYDLANKGTYDRNLENWEWLCRKCHMDKDGRKNNLLRGKQKHE